MSMHSGACYICLPGAADGSVLHFAEHSKGEDTNGGRVEESVPVGACTISGDCDSNTLSPVVRDELSLDVGLLVEVWWLDYAA